MKPGGLTATLNVSRVSLLLSSSVLFCTFSPQLLATRAAASDGDLKRGAEKFVTVVELKNASALLDLFFEQGTPFISGTYALPKAEYSPAEIRKDLENKSGVYCVFLDTRSLGQADCKQRARQKARPIQLPLTSVIDLVANAKVMKFVTFDVSAVNGTVACSA